MLWFKKRAPGDGNLKAQVECLRAEVDNLHMLVGLPQVTLRVYSGPPPYSAVGLLEAALQLGDGVFEARNVGFSAVYNLQLSPIVTVAQPNPQGKDFEIVAVQPEAAEAKKPDVEGLDPSDEYPEPNVMLQIVDATPTDLRLEFRSINALASKESKCFTATVGGAGVLQRHDVVTAMVRSCDQRSPETAYATTLKAFSIQGDRVESDYEIYIRPFSRTLGCRLVESRVIPIGQQREVDPLKDAVLGKGKIAAEAARVRLSEQQIKEGVGVWISGQK